MPPLFAPTDTTLHKGSIPHPPPRPERYILFVSYIYTFQPKHLYLSLETSIPFIGIDPYPIGIGYRLTPEPIPFSAERWGLGGGFKRFAQLFEGDIHVEGTVLREGYLTAFLAHNNHFGIRFLSQSERGAVPEPEVAAQFVAGSNRQYAAGRADHAVRNNHRAIVQGAVLKKDVLNQSGIDLTIEHFAGMDVAGEIHILLNSDQRAGLFARHIEARQYDGCHQTALLLVYVRGIFIEKVLQEIPAPGRAEREKEAPDLLLEDNDQRQRAHAGEHVQYTAHQLHLQHFGDQYPNKQEGEYTAKKRLGAARVEYLVHIKQEYRYQEDIHHILKGELQPKEHHKQGIIALNKDSLVPLNVPLPPLRAHRARAKYPRRPATGLRY